jgi:hypothetical protein
MNAPRTVSFVSLALVTALALAAPARAQTCPGAAQLIRDYTTIDNKRDPGIEMLIFCAHQASIRRRPPARAMSMPTSLGRCGRWSRSAILTTFSAAARRSWSSGH